MNKDLGSDLMVTHLELKSDLEGAIVSALRKRQEDFSVSSGLLDIGFIKGTALKTIRTGVLESTIAVPTIAILSSFIGRNKTVTIDALAIGDVTISYQLELLMSCGLTEKGVVQLSQVVSDMTQQIVELIDSEGHTRYAVTPIPHSEAKSLYLA